MKKLQTLSEIDTSNYDDFDKKYSYQKELTKKLDAINKDFNQEIINEIVLWKVNRYAKLDDNTLKLLNKISNQRNLEEELTKEPEFNKDISIKY